MKPTRCSQRDVHWQTRIDYRVGCRYRSKRAGREWRNIYHCIRRVDNCKDMQSSSGIISVNRYRVYSGRYHDVNRTTRKQTWVIRYRSGWRTSNLRSNKNRVKLTRRS